MIFNLFLQFLKQIRTYNPLAPPTIGHLLQLSNPCNFLIISLQNLINPSLLAYQFLIFPYHLSFLTFLVHLLVLEEVFFLIFYDLGKESLGYGDKYVFG